jgi:DNA-binding PadR family transcriptional regulator
MLILRTLQWGPLHGHRIGQAIRTQPDDLLKVETGSLYPALHRLEKSGWLEAGLATIMVVTSGCPTGAQIGIVEAST